MLSYYAEYMNRFDEWAASVQPIMPTAIILCRFEHPRSIIMQGFTPNTREHFNATARTRKDAESYLRKLRRADKAETSIPKEIRYRH